MSMNVQKLLKLYRNQLDIVKENEIYKDISKEEFMELYKIKLKTTSVTLCETARVRGVMLFSAKWNL